MDLGRYATCTRTAPRCAQSIVHRGRGLFKVAPFSAVGLVAVSPIALATAPPLVWFAGALDVSVSFFVYSREGCYALLAV